MAPQIQLQDEQTLSPFEVRAVYPETLSFVFIFCLVCMCTVLLLLLLTLLKQLFNITANHILV